MSGDDFTGYVKEVRVTLRRRAFLLCGDWHEADDLVQATLVKIFNRWSTLDRVGGLSQYTRTVMVRTFISDRRKAARSREVLSDRLPEPDPLSGEADRLPDRLLLLDALSRLGDRQRAIITLRYWEHLSTEEISSALGCSSATVRSQLCRGLARMRSLIDHPEAP